MATFTPGGKAHRILNRLIDGPATRAELAEIIRGPHQTPAGAKSRAWRFAIQLLADGLALTTGDGIEITATGQRMLARLDAELDETPARPTVRTFAYTPATGARA